jgi:transcriptional regulator GlxA family with amidase domain
MDNKAAARGAGQRNVAILVHEGVELLDFAGPGEVFSAARLPDEGGRAFNVYLVAESLEPIRSQGFVEITPNFTFETCPEPDLIVLPGGATGRPMNNPATMEWIEDSAPEAEVVLTVCTGALLLAKAGLLDGLAATTHHGSIAALRRMAPDTAVHEGLRYVDNGRIITTAGVSAGIDGALHLVSRLLGETAAVDAAWYMEYDWTPQEDAEEGVIVAGTSGSTAWVCPPCGEDCHDKTYDAPGTCENEACHMELVARRR